MRRRLDTEMARRGMAASADEAQTTIRAGRVTVAGRPALKAETLVAPADSIVVKKPAPQFVSRGGEKLRSALDAFGVEAQGSMALDAGASTGGFTDCLLSSGAAHVIAVDVGYGQFDWGLRADSRVTTLERTNVRDLSPSSLAYAPDLVVADLSFISLASVVGPLVRCSASRATFVLLVKPQFEATRDEVGEGGVVDDPTVWRAAIERVAAACVAEGLLVVAVAASPLLGPAGNSEFFVHARRTGRAGRADGAPTSVDVAIGEAAARGGERRMGST